MKIGAQMAKSHDKKKDERTNNDSLLNVLLKLPLTIFWMLILSAFISSLVEVLGIFFNWWELPGVKHSQLMLREELDYLRITLAKNAITAISGVSVQSLFDNSVGYVFRFFYDLGLFDNPDFTIGFGAYIGAVVNIFLVTFLRFFVFVFSIPLYLIFGYVAFVIGVFERDRRRAGGGRESGTLFQFSRKSILPSISIALFCYLAWPNSINPVFVFFPSALMCATAIAYMTASHKKYT
ncbi:MAG: DUF4400 domain-containing protein [Flavobacteriales bacterium]|nr:DUF4400 domain-containing protein [Flavobacteriales bacterium]